jgi:hypothetical protein
MPTTTPKRAPEKVTRLEKQAAAAIDAVAGKIHNAVRQELKDLRSMMLSKIDATIDRTLSRDGDGGFDAVVKALCEIADEQAAAASSWARSEAEEAAARELEQARADSETARQRLEAERADLAQRLAGADTIIAETERARDEIARGRADAEREAAAARQAAEAHGTALKEAHRRIEALEQERTTLALARDIAEAQLEGELRQKGRTDADAMHRHAAAALGRIRSALRRLMKSTSGQEVVDGALEMLAEPFTRVALFAVGRQGLTVWGSHGFDPPLPHRKAVPPAGADSPLMRAAADASPATAMAGDDETPLGLNGEPVGFAIALPITGKDQSPLVLYGEATARMSPAEAAVAEAMAEIMADYLGHRLRARRSAAASAAPAVYNRARQAPRVKCQESVKVAIDGEPSRLVDLSVHGAQVVTPHAVRPDGVVELLIPGDRSSLSCEARVVWVLVEPGQEREGALYRAGVQFTEVDEAAFEAFCRKYGIAEPTIKH